MKQGLRQPGSSRRRDNLQKTRTVSRREPKLPLAADAGQLMITTIPGQLFVDSGDRCGWRLQIRMKRLRQGGQALAAGQRLFEGRLVPVTPRDALRGGPTPQRGGIRKQVRR